MKFMLITMIYIVGSLCLVLRPLSLNAAEPPTTADRIEAQAPGSTAAVSLDAHQADVLPDEIKVFLLIGLLGAVIVGFGAGLLAVCSPNYDRSLYLAILLGIGYCEDSFGTSFR